MSTPRRVARLSLLIPVVLVIAFAGYRLVLHSRLRAAPEAWQPAPFTPSSPAIDEMRAAVKGANIVICVIDAARADHVGCYGYPRDTTPNIDRLAPQSLVFEQHFCQFPQTKPSTASLFTSRYPDSHLAYDNRRLDPGVFTLIRGLWEAGFYTVLFSSNHHASPKLGIGAHLDEAYYVPQLRQPRDPLAIWRPESLLRHISSWTKQELPSPFLAYVHFMPPHFPYHCPKEFRDLFIGKKAPNAWHGTFPFPGIEPDIPPPAVPDVNDWVNLYDANLRYGDWAVGELERLLREAGAFDNTLFIVTSDHGEAFGEHGYRMHNLGVYDELLHIPLLIKFPGDKGPVGRIDALTQTIDLLPTLFDLLELPYPRNTVQGRSLLPLLTGQVSKLNDYIFARAGGNPPSYVVRDKRSALILYRGGKLRALYDLEKDPQQRNNVIEDQPQQAARLLLAFREFAQSQVYKPLDFIDPEAKPGKMPRAPDMQFSEQDRKELRDLGYVD